MVKVNLTRKMPIFSSTQLPFSVTYSIYLCIRGTNGDYFNILLVSVFTNNFPGGFLYFFSHVAEIFHKDCLERVVHINYKNMSPEAPLILKKYCMMENGNSAPSTDSFKFSSVPCYLLFCVNS